MNRPHFLEFPIYKKRQISVFLFALLIFSSVLWIVLFGIKPGYAVLILFFVLFFFFLGRVELGIYAIGFSAFFHGWEIVFSRYTWARDIPYLPTINAPIVDFVALFFFIAVLFVLLLRIMPLAWNHLSRLFPYYKWYALFLFIAGVSALGAYENNIGESIKYLFKPIIFVYLFFVALPLFLLQRRKQLVSLARMLSWVAVGIAVFGAVGFGHTLFGYGWPRVQPFGFFGVNPFGYNHNMIAEVLVALIPFPFFMASIEKRIEIKTLYIFLGIFVISICLLTLSRAAWIVLLIEAGIALFFFAKTFKKNIVEYVRRFSLLVSLAVFLLVGYMLFFLSSSVVSSSNNARFVTLDIALFYTSRAPFIGHGPGMFIPVLRDTLLFTTDFGELLDAHGMLLKIGLETGILGLFAMFLFLVSVLHGIYIRARDTGDVLLFALFFSAFGAVSFQLFNTSYFNSHMWFPIGLALAGYQLSRYGDEYVIK